MAKLSKAGRTQDASAPGDTENHLSTKSQAGSRGPGETWLDAEAIVRTIRQPVVVLSGDLAVETANPAFYRSFEVGPEETEGRLIYDLGNGQWNIPALRELLENVLPNSGQIEDFRVEHDFERIGRRVMLLNAHRMKRADHPDRILLAIEDITEWERAQFELEGKGSLPRRLSIPCAIPCSSLGGICG